DDLNFSVTGKMGGEWNRLEDGHLLVEDDDGGISVNPAIPLGSGLTPRYEEISMNDMKEPGWKTSWDIQPGERLGVSIFPAKPFDWEKSFETPYVYSNVYPHPNKDKEEMFKEWKQYTNIGLLWESFYEARTENDHAKQYVVEDEALYQDSVDGLHANRMQEINYMSPGMLKYNYDDHRDIKDEVQRFRDTYGMDGVYYDGTHHDWVESMKLC